MYIAIIFVLSVLLSPFYYGKLKPYFIYDKNKFQITFPYKWSGLKAKRTIDNKYYQSPSRIGVILHESILHQSYKMLEFDYNIINTFYNKSCLNFPSIIEFEYEQYKILNNKFTKVKWCDLENNINGKAAQILSESIHKHGFGIISLNEDNEAYWIKNLYHFGFMYFQEPSNKIKYKKAQKFKYWNENGNRETIQFKCSNKCSKTMANFHQTNACKTYNAFYNISTTVTNALLNYAQKNCKLLKQSNIDIQAIMKEQNGERFNFDTICRNITLLRVLYYPLLNVFNNKRINMWNILSNIIMSIWNRNKLKDDKNYDEYNKMKKLIYLTHCDLGLVSLGAHSTNSGLQVLPFGHKEWINVYDLLSDNDIIVYCGYTLSCLTANYYQPLLHRVNMNLNENKLKPRLAMPFFYRLPDNIKIPLFKFNCHNYGKYKKNIIEKWISVGELVGNMQRNRILRRININYVRWIFGFVSQIIVTFFPHKQSDFFDNANKWV